MYVIHSKFGNSGFGGGFCNKPWTKPPPSAETETEGSPLNFKSQKVRFKSSSKNEHDERLVVESVVPSCIIAPWRCCIHVCQWRVHGLSKIGHPGFGGGLWTKLWTKPCSCEEPGEKPPHDLKHQKIRFKQIHVRMNMRIRARLCRLSGWKSVPAKFPCKCLARHKAIAKELKIHYV